MTTERMRRTCAFCGRDDLSYKRHGWLWASDNKPVCSEHLDVYELRLRSLRGMPGYELERN